MQDTAILHTDQDSAPVETATAEGYQAPVLSDLGEAAAVTLGSNNFNNADKSQYWQA